MFYMNCGSGKPCGAVTLCDVKIRNKHGKKSLVAVWRYSQRNCNKFQESPIRMSNGRMVFDSGSERTINVMPDNLMKKYQHLID